MAYIYPTHPVTTLSTKFPRIRWDLVIEGKKLLAYDFSGANVIDKIYAHDADEAGCFLVSVFDKFTLETKHAFTSIVDAVKWTKGFKRYGHKAEYLPCMVGDESMIFDFVMFG